MQNNTQGYLRALKWHGIFATSLGLLACTSLAYANEAITREVTGARLMLREAVATQNAAAINDHLVPEYVYVHGNGRTNNKAERATLLLAGNAMEVQPEEDVSYQAINSNTVVVRGQTKMPARGSSEAFLLKWNAVYLRSDTGWKIGYVQSWR